MTLVVITGNWHHFAGCALHRIFIMIFTTVNHGNYFGFDASAERDPRYDENSCKIEAQRWAAPGLPRLALTVGAISASKCDPGNGMFLLFLHYFHDDPFSMSNFLFILIYLSIMYSM